MFNILVTGGAGFIGSQLIRRLLKEKKNKVFTIDNLSTGQKKNISKGVTFIKGNCYDPKIYNKINNYKFDVIFHIAGQSSGEISFEDPIYDIRTNLESTILLLEFAKKTNCKKFIYASSMSVYGNKTNNPVKETFRCNPISFYGIGKLSSEKYMSIYQKFGVKCISLRFFNVYGPGQNLQNKKQGMISIYMAQFIEKNQIVVKGSGDRFRDFIYIDDVVESLIRSMNLSQNKFEIINIGSGNKTKVKDIISQLGKIYKKPIEVIYEGKTNGDIHGIYSNNQKMINLLKFKPRVSLSIGLKNMIEWTKTISSPNIK